MISSGSCSLVRSSIWLRSDYKSICDRSTLRSNLRSRNIIDSAESESASVKTRGILSCLIVFAVFILVSSAAIPNADAKPASSGSRKDLSIPSGNQAADGNERLRLIESRLDVIQQKLSTSSDLQVRISAIEKKMNDLKGSAWPGTLLPAIISALSALAGLWLGNRVAAKLQEERLKQEATLARERAKGDIGNAVIDWELKQLALLYGPMRALLGQSLGLYRQMSRVLANSRKNEFRLAQSSSSPDGWTLEVQGEAGQWERFRTVLHICRIYGHGFGVDTYFDEIVGIGQNMVGIIRKQAGCARPEEKDLMAVFAQYLAHFAVLKHVHQEAQEQRLRTENTSANEDPKDSPMAVDLSAVFPEEIHGLINQGFDALTQSVQQWRQKAVS
jgi:hypothetical protein